MTCWHPAAGTAGLRPGRPRPAVPAWEPRESLQDEEPAMAEPQVLLEGIAFGEPRPACSYMADMRGRPARLNANRYRSESAIRNPAGQHSDHAQRPQVGPRPMGKYPLCAWPRTWAPGMGGYRAVPAPLI